MRVDFKDVLFFVVLDLGSHRRSSINSFSVGSVVHHVSDDDDRLIDEPGRNFDVFNVFSEFLLGIVYKRLVHFGQVFDFFSEVVVFIWFLEIVSGHIDDFVGFVVFEVMENVFVEGIISQNDFISFSD